MIGRRLFSLGLLAAPAIIRTPGLLMSVRPWSDPADWLRREMEWALMQAMKQAGPIHYNPRGWTIMKNAMTARLDDIIGVPIEFTINGFKVVA